MGNFKRVFFLLAVFVLSATGTYADGVLVVTFDEFSGVLQLANMDSLSSVNGNNPVYKEIVWDEGIAVFGENYRISEEEQTPAFGIPHSGSYAVTNYNNEAVTLTTSRVLMGFWAGQNEYYGYGGGTDAIRVHALDGSGNILASVAQDLPDNEPDEAEPLRFVDTSAFHGVSGIQAYRIEPAAGCTMDCNWIADDFVFTDGAYCPVPDTGQTQSFTEHPGEDSDYTINPPSYAKLDVDGNPLADGALSWAMVRDNVTGLIWEVKTRDGSVHDRDNRYTWYDPDTASNGGNPGTPGNGTDTQDFIQALNTQNFGGYSDWRLPTIGELTAITNRGCYDPAVNTDYFPNAKSFIYWSSVTYAQHTDHALGVDFTSGFDDDIEKSRTDIHARAVRSDMPGVEPQVHFIANGDGTVTDLRTGLMFQQITPEERMTWEDALNYCETLSLAGHEDWRLPTAEELRAMVDHGTFSPAVDSEIFPDTSGSYYWSSTTSLVNPDAAWANYFFNGLDVTGADKNEAYFVRAVRLGGNDEGTADDLMISVGAEPAVGRIPFETSLSCTVISGTPPYEFTWIFDDGTDAGDTQNTAHTYDTPGMYTVTCTVVDADDRSTSGAVVIEVGEPFDYPDDYIVLEDAAPLRISSGSVYFVYGNHENNTVILESGAGAKLTNFPGNNTITIESDSGGFTVSRSGAYVTFEGNDGTLLKMPATLSPQAIVFNDGSLALSIDSGEILLGGQIVTAVPALIGGNG